MTASTSTMRPRTNLYLGLNTCFCFLVVTSGIAMGNGNPRIVYLCLLFAICSSIVLYADKLNGRYAILCIFLPIYFFFYGAADIAGLVGIPPLTAATGILSLAEFAILLGALLLTCGYRFAISMTGRNRKQVVVKDWPGTAVVSVALILWSTGIVSTWIWQTDSTFAFKDNQHQPGSFAIIAFLIGRYSQVLGLALLAYRFAESKSKQMFFLILSVFVIEFVFGFFADSKELAIRAPTLAILTMYLLDGKVPKKWFLAVGVIVFLSFPIFQAYRTAVLGGRGLTAGQAAEDMVHNLQIALDFHENENKDGKVEAVSSRGSLSFLSRTSLKSTMELIIDRVGNNVPYQKGYTIGLVMTAFVPRLFWPSKPDSSVGQLFNREFGISEDKNTYISATHLGELYWNFGWPGIAIGMTLIGYLLGYVNSRTDLSQQRSVARFLIIVLTVYLICLRFEGGIALQYIQWMRSLAIVIFLNILFARLTYPKVSKSSPADGCLPLQGRSEKPFPNLMK